MKSVPPFEGPGPDLQPRSKTLNPASRSRDTSAIKGNPISAVGSSPWICSSQRDAQPFGFGAARAVIRLLPVADRSRLQRKSASGTCTRVGTSFSRMLTGGRFEQRDRGVKYDFAPAGALQLLLGALAVSGLVQSHTIEIRDLVGANDESAGIGCGGGLGFGPRQAQCRRFGGLAGKRCFVYVRGKRLEMAGGAVRATLDGRRRWTREPASGLDHGSVRRCAGGV